jgi:hypothetical protein
VTHLYASQYHTAKSFDAVTMELGSILDQAIGRIFQEPAGLAPFPVVCAWCNRVKNPDGSYSTGSVGVDAVVSHGMCPGCEREQARCELG